MLTADSLVRLLAIKMRLACDVPVVFVGETGCGKTHLVHFFRRLCGYRVEVINVHGGLSALDLHVRVQQIIASKRGGAGAGAGGRGQPAAERVGRDGAPVMCDRVLMGRRVPDNVKFMNPVRYGEHFPAMPGLDFQPYTRRGGRGGSGDVARLAVAVALLRCGPRGGASGCTTSIARGHVSLAWDFGTPSQSMVSRAAAAVYPWRWGCVGGNR